MTPFFLLLFQKRKKKEKNKRITRQTGYRAFTTFPMMHSEISYRYLRICHSIFKWRFGSDDDIINSFIFYHYDVGRALALNSAPRQERRGGGCPLVRRLPVGANQDVACQPFRILI
jgi:hypothetical protein